MTLRVSLPCGSALVLILALTSSCANGRSAGEGASAAAPAWLARLAQKVATNSGDASPVSAEFAMVDGDTVAPVVGLASGDPARMEYLVVLGGTFTGGFSAPAGRPLPTGSTIVFTVDPGTHVIQDIGLPNSPPDLGAVGPMQRLELATG